MIMYNQELLFKCNSVSTVMSALEKKGYAFFDSNKMYNVNLFAVRCNEHADGKKVDDKFSDVIGVIYRDDKTPQKLSIDVYPCTTVPGLYYFKNPMMPEFGTAILAPGQYRGALSIGKHYGQDALVQTGMLSVFRDANRDEIINLKPDTKNSGNWFGLNVHYSADSIQSVSNWSAGCTVLPYSHLSPVYRGFVNVFKKSLSAGFANKITYTLLLESELCL